ncbi:hypothetical protein SCHPADRAFT_5859 [Schizopora paradoxa]|uniref:Uncharacterized protein n=1 Tax=Schizopora paradoxa TaxID=27342 RepID=A0A0H2S874_9AGAM|nr:hypothetical protein SCHPADRAFT_5859 [Schizopora paradoxa]
MFIHFRPWMIYKDLSRFGIQATSSTLSSVKVSEVDNVEAFREYFRVAEVYPDADDRCPILSCQFRFCTASLFAFNRRQRHRFTFFTLLPFIQHRGYEMRNRSETSRFVDLFAGVAAEDEEVEGTEDEIDEDEDLEEADREALEPMALRLIERGNDEFDAAFEALRQRATTRGGRRDDEYGEDGVEGRRIDAFQSLVGLPNVNDTHIFSLQVKAGMEQVVVLRQRSCVHRGPCPSPCPTILPPSSLRVSFLDPLHTHR